ncbi:MAG: pyridoxamine 5'-phosphate oxidase [Planctomycetota bacterium]|jgi:pyridoxamine 5'-phosphate oxidase
MTFDSLRRNYEHATLFEEEMAPAPMSQFQAWFQQAQEVDIHLPDAMVLATVDAEGRPNARTVVLRGIEDDALRFYTNYGSDKATELANNPAAALHFHWNRIERQVKVRGHVEKTDRAESEEYWASRPRASQIGGWASPQSTTLTDRADLDERAAKIERRFSGQDVPCPENWGGYRLVAETVEFWQGRTSRLHDRMQYVRDGDGWKLERLAP